MEKMSDKLCVTMRLSKNVFRHIYTAQKTDIHSGKVSEKDYVHNHCVCHTDLAVYKQRLLYTSALSVRQWPAECVCVCVYTCFVILSGQM